ncbi:hypothetical protein [Rhodovarius crocodyli]|uniref:hypothetical protein n=1 Tax=Rhodovarius crocodyli TaxID=1979269 RepID=UPI0013E3C04F|nr:hypothetical protein [Rhodovarius crocodyli]
MRWDRGHSYTNLVVRMHDGHEHHIRHTTTAPGWGVDAYEVEKAIQDALNLHSTQEH